MSFTNDNILGGETIKEMQNSTGCRINVLSQSHPSDPEREIQLSGSPDAIQRAKMAIDEKVDNAVSISCPPCCIPWSIANGDMLEDTRPTQRRRLR